MPRLRHHGTLPDDDGVASSWGCYSFLLRRRGYRRLDSGAARAVRVEVVGSKKTTTARRRSVVFDVDAAVLEAEPVRSLVAVDGRRVPGDAAVAVAVDAMLFEHLLWLAATADDDGGRSAADLSEIVEFYSQEDDDDDGGHGFKRSN